MDWRPKAKGTAWPLRRACEREARLCQTFRFTNHFDRQTGHLHARTLRPRLGGALRRRMRPMPTSKDDRQCHMP